jgi:hypothetical protein
MRCAFLLIVFRNAALNDVLETLIRDLLVRSGVSLTHIQFRKPMIVTAAIIPMLHIFTKTLSLAENKRIPRIQSESVKFLYICSFKS